MPVTLNASSRARMGLHGTPGEDYVQHKDVIRIRAAGAFLIDRPDEPVTEAMPGDTVVIWSRTAINTLSALVGAEAHPQLLKAGFVSFPRFYTADHIGPVSVLFKCEQQINLAELPWLLVTWNMGELRQ